MTIEHVVFDIGRVLVHWDPEIPYRRLIADDAERAAFLSQVCSPAWNLEQDRGRPWADAEAELIERHPHHDEMIRAYRAHWVEMVPHAYEGSVALYRWLLARGVDVTLLTNFAADTFEEASAIYGFLAEARGVTVSGRIGRVKPDAEIFEHHAASFDLAPQATLFIDDSAANVEGARRAGWKAVQFHDPEGLARDLLAHGLPVPTAG